MIDPDALSMPHPGDHRWRLRAPNGNRSIGVIEPPKVRGEKRRHSGSVVPFGFGIRDEVIEQEVDDWLELADETDEIWEGMGL